MHAQKKGYTFFMLPVNVYNREEEMRPAHQKK